MAEVEAAMSRPGAHTASSAAVLDATRAVATLGGFKAVHFKSVAKQAGVTVGSVYDHFTSKTHLLVTLLAREFVRLDEERDWSTCAASPIRRVESLTRRLHDEWQQNVKLTEAVVRAFVTAGTDEALAAQHAADLIESMLARALSGGTEGIHERQIAGLIADIWLANLMAFVGGRATAEQTRECIDGAMRLVLDVGGRQRSLAIPAVSLRY
ncbi:TetR family transcriptional regulator [Mycobacterium intracellulare]|uniref:TetR family transcriptional regulator n=1 Tax=Mycobacterium intracellulare TaxID=1767 RepID=UPI0011554D28|nr:TetR family transcriptional regulator [Mycobacterium intracellulare]MEE3802499.1 TetR family transcriptional regulator [Mycobacterium intracellulare]